MKAETHHIFLLNSELRLIVGDLPSKPNYADYTQSEHDAYIAKIEQLKKEAIKIKPDYDDKPFGWEMGRWFLNHVEIEEGEIYPVNCEVEYKDIPEEIILPDKRIPAHRVAILKPKQEPIETQNFLVWWPGINDSNINVDVTMNLFDRLVEDTKNWDLPTSEEQHERRIRYIRECKEKFDKIMNQKDPTQDEVWEDAKVHIMDAIGTYPSGLVVSMADRIIRYLRQNNYTITKNQ